MEFKVNVRFVTQYWSFFQCKYTYYLIEVKFYLILLSNEMKHQHLFLVQIVFIVFHIFWLSVWHHSCDELLLIFWYIFRVTSCLTYRSTNWCLFIVNKISWVFTTLQIFSTVKMLTLICYIYCNNFFGLETLIKFSWTIAGKS